MYCVSSTQSGFAEDVEAANQENRVEVEEENEKKEEAKDAADPVLSLIPDSGVGGLADDSASGYRGFSAQSSAIRTIACNTAKATVEREGRSPTPQQASTPVKSAASPLPPPVDPESSADKSDSET